MKVIAARIGALVKPGNSCGGDDEQCQVPEDHEAEAKVAAGRKHAENPTGKYALPFDWFSLMMSLLLMRLR
jgi:hypothetical protein